MTTKKLIEVALPLDVINDASAFDKRPGIGPHPKSLHHWWARLPLPTARAILFASIADDPSEHPDKFPTEGAQNAERERLFEILRGLMQKRLHEHPEVYAAARTEMLKYCGGTLPSLFDPFSGGGSIPLEANRLGFETYAGDLNPVAVLLNRCNLELAPRWTGHPPVNPQQRTQIGGEESWRGCHGLAADVRYYGQLTLDHSRQKIGHLYPRVQLPDESGGKDANVIAWIWARTVASPNPVLKRAHVPLLSTMILSNKPDRSAWIEIVRDKRGGNAWSPRVRTGVLVGDALAKAKLGTKAGKAQDFLCVLTGEPIRRSYVQAEGKAGHLRKRLVAIVADGRQGRIYLSPTAEHESAGNITDARAEDARGSFLAGPLPTRAEITGGVCTAYGLNTWGHLFETRQLVAMLTFSELVRSVVAHVRRDALAAGLRTDHADSYATAVATFLALALDRCADSNNSLCRWDKSAAGQRVKNLFGRQAIPMLFDFAEANILGEKSVCWKSAVDLTAEAIESLASFGGRTATVKQVDAPNGIDGVQGLLVSTDPPYYDNISYATLSDFFYVWLRHTLGHSYPDLFATVLTPKTPELIASPDRFGGSKTKAKEHFESGFRRAFTSLKGQLDPRFPVTVYYAFKQEDERSSEDEDEDADSAVTLTTGWETLLEALIGSGFQITATWPVRASQKWRMVSMGANALASYIVLACRLRDSEAPNASKQELLTALKSELPRAIKRLQQANIAPVDLAQAALGPGMAIFSRYSRVIDSSGGDFSVRAALSAINGVLDEALSAQDADYDADTRFAVTWFEGHGFEPGEYGEAETLATARNVSVRGVADGGILRSKAGRVRLLRSSELAGNWNPATDSRLSIWEAMQQLVRVLEAEGEAAAAGLLGSLPISGDMVRELTYRVFKTCERRGWADDARSFNGLVVAWPELVRMSGAPAGGQSELGVG